MDTCAHIYLIQDGNYRGTNIFKIGKTTQGIAINNIIKLKRFTNYSNGTVQHNTWLVSSTNVDDIESKIKIYFKNKYKLIKGHEWFEGDVKQMKKDIDFIIENNNIVNNSIHTDTKIYEIKKINAREWQNNITYMDYKFITKLLLDICINEETINMFKEYIINILDKSDNKYGVLIIPGYYNGDVLLDILRQIFQDDGSGIYNRYDNPRNARERLLRHDDIGERAIQVIKANQNCHHVYLWRDDITEVKAIYEKNKIRYTICNIINDTSQKLQHLNESYKYSLKKNDYRNQILSMLNDYLKN